MGLDANRKPPAKVVTGKKLSGSKSTAESAELGYQHTLVRLLQ